MEWFRKDSRVFVIVINEVYFTSTNKLSKEDILRFNRDFSCDLKYHGLLSDMVEENKGYRRLCGYDSEDFKIPHYSFSHHLIEKWHGEIQDYLENREIEGDLTIFSTWIQLIVPDTLSDFEISDFEEKFNLKYSGDESFSRSQLKMYNFNIQ